MATKKASSRVKPSKSNAVSFPFAPMGMVLGVRDIEQAIKFYETLGFQLNTALPGSDGQLTVAFLTFGSSMLLLGRLAELHYEHEVRAKQIHSGLMALESR